jgi:ABC-type polar amino acid transport system ATPase subunit
MLKGNKIKFAHKKSEKKTPTLDIVSFAVEKEEQQQRVAIARALVMRPRVLLLDKPTSALDPTSKSCLEMLLKELSKQGITIAISSHDMHFIGNMMDRIYFLENGNIVEEFDEQVDLLQDKLKIANFLIHANRS